MGDDWKHGRGLGFGITHTKERDVVGHGGGFPGYFTATNVGVREGVGVIVYANSLVAEVYLGSTWSISDRIFDWVVPAINSARDGDEGEAIKPEWKPLEGSYHKYYMDSHVMFLDGQMVLMNPNVPNPKQSLAFLEPISGR